MTVEVNAINVDIEEVKMYNCPSQEVLSQFPQLYETEHIPVGDKIVHAHFFIGGSDWYLIETDGDICFGFVILNHDYDCAEYGYFSLSELQSVRVGPFEIEYDEFWTPRPIKDIGRIQMTRMGAL